MTGRRVHALAVVHVVNDHQLYKPVQPQHLRDRVPLHHVVLVGFGGEDLGDVVVGHRGRLLQEVDHVVDGYLELILHRKPQIFQVLVELLPQTRINLYLRHVHIKVRAHFFLELLFVYGVGCRMELGLLLLYG